MRENEGTFRGAGGTELFYRAATPADRVPKAAVLLVHGHGDHSGGLYGLITRLTDNGCTVYAPDLRGHGRSPGTRGFIRSWDEYREDLHALRTRIDAEQPSLPLYLMAHSLGGVISLDYVVRHGAGVAGLAAIAPAISYEATPLGKLLVLAMGRFKPDYTVEKTGDLRQLTRDPDMLAKLQADPLRHNTVTPGLGRGLLRTLPMLTKSASSIRLPLLLQYGLADEITPPAELHRFFDSVGSPDKQRIAYEDVRHRPFDDLGRETFFADLLGWLDRQTAAGTHKTPSA
ncbi:lysophospholipase [uncultured Paenibacillus sp.]|uniref:alpha/beta hydrolase n=1 Tax=uncultured Paenibacillus sp. TaxID=227322 RepID=UPI0028D3F504|nr:lysophospholipase [uncultured Paenibacillus sp.]